MGGSCRRRSASSLSLTHPRCAPQLANQGHPGAAERVLLSPACGPATGGLARAGGARTIRADVARAMGKQRGDGSVRDA